ncbi:MAG: T9SS type A sorting domain-containing protein [Bacteroidetes bacterium]|nr:T9SS type A sorting domain-containing protein [Bacteroidota bacterium]
MIDADDNKWISTNDGGFAFYGIIPTVGIKNSFVAANINLYPNPAKEAITIDLGDLELNEAATFKVIDVLGKEVKAIHLNSKANGVSKTALDLKDLENGVYFYTVSTNHSILKTGKFVKN